VANTFRNLAVGLPYPSAETDAPSVEISEVENEVLQLFDASRRPLLRYTISLGLSVDDGEEIVQDAFLSLFNHLRLGKPRTNLSGWLFRVAHNLALKQRGANQRRKKMLEIDATIAESRRCPAPNPEEQLASNQENTRLRAVLRALPPRDQACLRLRAEGLRYREISKVLGMSLGAVSISITRSLQRLGAADQG